MTDQQHSNVQKQLISLSLYARQHNPQFALGDLDKFMIFDQNKIREDPPVIDILKWDQKAAQPVLEELKYTDEEIQEEVVHQRNTVAAVKQTPLALTQKRIDKLYGAPEGTVVFNLDTESLCFYKKAKGWVNMSPTY